MPSPGPATCALFNLEDIGPSYALTLKAWRARFHAQLEQVRALGYDTRFIRMWDFYLAYCEGGFRERSIGDVHLWLTRPAARPDAISLPVGIGVKSWPNFIASQLLWLAAVAGAAHGHWWLGPLAFLLFAVVQLAPRYRARGDVMLMLLALPVGLVVDSTMAATGLLHYASPFPSPHFAPVWILALWMGFALTFNHSLAWLMGRPVVAVLCRGNHRSIFLLGRLRVAGVRSASQNPWAQCC